MKPLEILSYNIEFGRKFDDVVAWIESENLSPDIFCFQEFPEARIPFFKEFLQKRGYDYAFTPAIELNGIDLGELTAHKSSTLDLKAQKGMELGKYFWEKSRRRVKGERSALVTSYQYEGQYVALANVHLSNFSPHSMRYRQLDMVIKELQQHSEDAIIVGDFNYSSLFGVKRLFNFMSKYDYTIVGKRMITHKIFKRIPQQLDYVFQKGFIPEEINVLKVPHSDHLPLHMKLSLNTSI